MWVIKGKIMTGILGNIFVKGDMAALTDHIETNYSKNLVKEEGGWKTYQINDIYFSIYWRKFIIWKETSTKELNKTEIIPIVNYIMNESKEWIATLKDILPRDIASKQDYNYIRFAFCDYFNIMGKEELISEGITTFNYKIYNVSSNKKGLLRVSRHLVMCCGLSNFFKQEIINLCYENILHDKNKIVSGKAVFSLMDGLSRYAIPSEESHFLQELTIKATVLFAFISIAGNVICSSDLSFKLKLLLLVATVVSVIPSWKFLSFITLFNRKI